MFKISKNEADLPLPWHYQLWVGGWSSQTPEPLRLVAVG